GAAKLVQEAGRDIAAIDRSEHDIDALARKALGGPADRLAIGGDGARIAPLTDASHDVKALHCTGFRVAQRRFDAIPEFVEPARHRGQAAIAGLAVSGWRV